MGASVVNKVLTVPCVCPVPGSLAVAPCVCVPGLVTGHMSGGCACVLV